MSHVWVGMTKSVSIMCVLLNVAKFLRALTPDRAVVVPQTCKCYGQRFMDSTLLGFISVDCGYFTKVIVKYI